MANEATWHPHTEHGTLDDRERNNLPENGYPFPKQRKEPLTDARHVRNVLARFDQVQGVSDADRDLAFANIRKAASHYKVEIAEDDWQQPGKQPYARSSAHRTRSEHPW